MSGEAGREPGRWYAAHVLLYTEFLDGLQDHYLVWENIYLIYADTIAHGFEQAEQLGREEEEADSNGHTVDGRPARFRFAGIRRLAECIDFDNGPANGKEVTYLEYTFKDKATLDAMLERRAAVVNLEPTHAQN